jgi:hypothetical protein
MDVIPNRAKSPARNLLHSHRQATAASSPSLTTRFGMTSHELERRHWPASPQIQSPKNSNAAWASHPSRIGYVDFCSAFVTAGRRNDCFSPTALPRGSATFAEAQWPSVISRSPTCHCCGASNPIPFPKNKIKEEAATPGHPVAQARFWNVPDDSPSRITGCRWPTAIIQQVQKPSRFRLGYFRRDRSRPQQETGFPLCRTCGR